MAIPRPPPNTQNVHYGEKTVLEGENQYQQQWYERTKGTFQPIHGRTDGMLHL